MDTLPDYHAFPSYPKTPMRTLFTGAGDDALDLLGKCLLYDPTCRISALDAIQHPYFTNSPPPTAPSQLPRHTLKRKAPTVKDEKTARVLFKQ